MRQHRAHGFFFFFLSFWHNILRLVKLIIVDTHIFYMQALPMEIIRHSLLFRHEDIYLYSTYSSLFLFLSTTFQKSKTFISLKNLANVLRNIYCRTYYLATIVITYLYLVSCQCTSHQTISNGRLGNALNKPRLS